MKQPGKSIIFALIASLCFFMSNYILGNKSILGALAREATEGGTLIYAIIFFLIQYCRALWKGESYWTWQTSNFRNPRTNGFYWTNFIGLVIYVTINIAAGFSVVYTFKFALDGNLNQGILTCLFGLSAIFSAVIAYFVFGEHLKGAHVSSDK